MQQKSIAANIHQCAHNDHEYEQFLQQIRDKFASMIAENEHLFTTTTSDLFSKFLGELPAEVRQHYTCHACRKFVDTYGGIVSVSNTGIKTSAIWDSRNTPELYRNSVKAIEKAVLKARINGVFLSKETVWGQPVTGEWHHMAVTPPRAVVYAGVALTPFQAMAEKKEDFKTLIRGLLEYPVAAIDQALRVLKSDTLYRSEKCLGIAEWLKRLHTARGNTKNNTIKTNLTWAAVASAPAGFCHVKSTMIGTLLDDIVAGLSFDDISKRFADKMHPLQYQRPQAAPTAGNIKQAEEIVKKLGIENSLKRRFARFDELKLIWKPLKKIEPEKKADGIFGHLKPNGMAEIAEISIPVTTMTFERFRATVLPEALSIEYWVTNTRGPYSALITASDMEAPPILQWDFTDNRNPVSLYVYSRGSIPEQWGLNPHSYRKVNGICFRPEMWNWYQSNISIGAFFVLNGAMDLRYSDSGLAIFPEILKSELHGIRSTIEAFSTHGTLDGSDEGSACGLMLQKGIQWNARFRVTTESGRAEYNLDRWE